MIYTVKGLKIGENATIFVTVHLKEAITKRYTSEEYCLLTLEDHTGNIKGVLGVDCKVRIEDINVGMYARIQCKVVHTGKNKLVIINSIQPLTKDQTSEAIEELAQEAPAYINRYDIYAFHNFLEFMDKPYKEIAISITGAYGTNKALWNELLKGVASQNSHGPKAGDLFKHICGAMRQADSEFKTASLTRFLAKREWNELMLRTLAHDIGKLKQYNLETGEVKKDALDHEVYGSLLIRDTNRLLGSPLVEKEEAALMNYIAGHHNSTKKQIHWSRSDKVAHFADMLEAEYSKRDYTG